MTIRKANNYRPNTVSHPGESIAELLREQSMTQSRAAEIIGVTLPYLNDVIHGKRGISTKMAIRLEDAGFSEALLWLHHQVAYDLAAARAKRCP